MNQYDYIIIGAGFAGAVAARELAEKGGKKILLIERRDHIAGNAYDCLDETDILIHKYGPHIFHTNNKDVYEYLSRFTLWNDYSHEVVASIRGTNIPVPFNLNSLSFFYDEATARKIKDVLISKFGMGSKVSIMELRKSREENLKDLAQTVYENVFLYYTTKQWGLTPEEIDPETTARVPVYISYDNRYFNDTYQGLPQDGYAKLFEKLLDHPDIELYLGTEASELLKFNSEGIYFDGKKFNGEVIYTGAVDELFGYCYGMLPYRTLDFCFETHNLDFYQSRGTVNYTVNEDYTRITEFKHMTKQNLPGRTTIVKEYSRAYTGKKGETPYYAIINCDNNALYERYRQLAAGYKNLYLLGRLAEYKYYNMDTIVERALTLCENLLSYDKLLI